MRVKVVSSVAVSFMCLCFITAVAGAARPYVGSDGSNSLVLSDGNTTTTLASVLNRILLVESASAQNGVKVNESASRATQQDIVMANLSTTIFQQQQTLSAQASSLTLAKAALRSAKLGFMSETVLGTLRSPAFITDPSNTVYNTVGVLTAMAVTTAGNPIVAFWAGSAAFSLLFCGDSTCSDAAPRTVRVVDTVDLGGAKPSIQLKGPSNNQTVSLTYYDATAQDLKLLVCSDTLCSNGSRTVTTVASAGDVGYFSSLRLAPGTQFPVIAFGNNSAGVTDRVLIATCNDALCVSKTIRTIAGSGTGYYLSLALTAAGLPVIAMYQTVTGTGNLKAIVCSDATCASFAIRDVQLGGDVGYNPSVIIPSSTGFPLFVYFANGNVRVAACSDAGCANSKTLSTVDASSGSYYGLATDPATGFPVVAYRNTKDLLLAVCKDSACSNTANTVLRTVATTGRQGNIVDLVISPVTGFPVISFLDTIDPTNIVLKLVVCADITCL